MDLSAIAGATPSPASILVARTTQQVYQQMAAQLLAGLPPPAADSASFSAEGLARLAAETPVTPSPPTPD